MRKKLHEPTGQRLPENDGKTPDKKMRRLDCAVLNLYLTWLADDQGVFYDSVRCGFVEGATAFEGSGVRHQSHVQVAVRNAACVIGVFSEVTVKNRKRTIRLAGRVEP